MKTYPDVTELYRRKESNLKNEAKRSIPEKMAIAGKLRDIQERLAPLRAANKAKRSIHRVMIQIKTA